MKSQDKTPNNDLVCKKMESLRIQKAAAMLIEFSQINIKIDSKRFSVEKISLQIAWPYDGQTYVSLTGRALKRKITSAQKLEPHTIA